MRISPEGVRELVGFGREQSGVEFKGPGPRTDSSLRAKVVRAMLAMANRRDGGMVLVGVTDDGSNLEIAGLLPDDVGTWRHDHLADTVAVYADPRVEFDTYVVEVDNKRVVVITVEEFSDVPVICKAECQVGSPKSKVVLRNGAIYVRSNRKPESREVANFDEMRGLLDIATEKAVRRFVALTRAVGAASGLNELREADHESLFRDERGEL